MTVSPVFDDPHDRNDYKRDELEGWLAGTFPGVHFSTSYWDWIAAYKRAARIAYAIRNSDFNPMRVYEFDSCHWQRSRGMAFVQADGKAYRKGFSCGEPGCLKCDPKKRARLSMDRMDDFKAIYKRHGKDLRYAHSIVFTLPESVEADPLHNPEIEKKLLAEIQGLIRRLYGRKTRSNIAMWFSVHPCSDGDFLRDRWHVHAMIIPAEIMPATKTAPRQFFAVRPAWILPGHRPDRWKIDFSRVRDNWGDAIEKVFGRDFDHIANPQHTLIQYRTDKIKDFHALVAHKMKYDGRSFAKDISNSVLRTAYAENIVVLKATRETDEKNYWYYAVDVHDLVGRYKWIREKNRTRARGWASCLEKYADALDLEAPELEENDPAPDAIRVVAEVWTDIRREFDADAKAVIWKKTQWYYYTDPWSGLMVERLAEEMEPWRWKIMEDDNGQSSSV